VTGLPKVGDSVRSAGWFVRVLLVDMPFASLETPSPAISVLKARLEECGTVCDAAYANLAFADFVSAPAYRRIAHAFRPDALAGEWVFAACLFGATDWTVGAYLRDVVGGMPAADRDLLRAARAAAPEFVTMLLRTVSWDDYELVGFASSCSQNLAALALAREVKARHPRTTIVFGGANWQGEMGLALLRRFPFVDIAFLGEADDSLPAVIERLDAARGAAAPRLDDVAGIAFRDGAGIHVTAEAAPIGDLDRLPPPDFSDYFTALARHTSVCDLSEVHLWVQTSRGCWWAERAPCRFCGLNGRTRAYRTKSPGSILRELRGVAGRWPGFPIDLTDTVVSPGFLAEVLPALAAEPLRVPLWFEVRPDLSRAQVHTIAAAGGDIQIGVESLSDRALRLMGKGSRVLECLRLLKWCKAEGVDPGWNIIHDIPGETDADYAELIRLLPALRCLRPPRWCGPMSLDRFSTFMTHAGAYGIEEVRSPEAYGHVYPFAEDELCEIAYTFRYRRDRGLLRSAHIRRLYEDVQTWKEEAARTDLRLCSADQTTTVVETRPGAADREFVLDDLDALLYAACDDIGVKPDLVGLAAARFAAEEDVEALVDARLQRFLDDRLMVAVGERYLSLALPARPEAAPAS